EAMVSVFSLRKTKDVKTVRSLMRPANSNIIMNIYTHAVSSKKRQAPIPDYFLFARHPGKKAAFMVGTRPIRPPSRVLGPIGDGGHFDASGLSLCRSQELSRLPSITHFRRDDYSFS